jgi:glycosyltransferase involved in cell wall biosynthesis
MEPANISETPLVSAVVPAYNAERYLEQTLKALVTQSYEHLEIIVVDDGSEDTTLRIAQAMAHRYPQIRVIHQSNQGVASARNRGIEAAQGEFIAPIDADDIWFPQAVAKLTHCLGNADALTGVVYGWAVTLDEDGLLNGGWCCSTIAGEVLGTLICHDFLGTASATLIRRECFIKVGGYDPHFHTESAQGCEDWDLYLRIAQYYRFTVVPEFLFGYRVLQSGMSANTHAMAKSHRYLLEKIKLRHPHTPEVFYQLSQSSYYLYLARKCNLENNPHESLYWLGQAVMNGPVCTLIRFGFYWLLVNNVFALFGSSLRRFTGYSNQRTSEPRTAVLPKRRILQVADIEKKRAPILLKLAAQEVLHRLVQWLPRWRHARRKETHRNESSG